LGRTWRHRSCMADQSQHMVMEQLRDRSASLC
jgi:hypothetical protein